MSTTYDLHVGAIGAVITLSLIDGAAVNLTTAAITEIRLRGPSGPRLTKTATIAGAATLGVLTYTTVDGDLRHPGDYHAQAHVIFDDDTEFWSSWFDFSVGPNL
jgi:hypothetical protein